MCINLCGELPKNVNNLRAFRDRVSLCMTETRHFVDHVPVFNDSIVYHESRWPITKQNERGGEEDASGESRSAATRVSFRVPFPGKKIRRKYDR